ncbi:hypothetical protein A4A49_62665, partial [Nicotiana attenuata]
HSCLHSKVKGFCDLAQLNSPLKPFFLQGYLKVLSTTNILKSIQVGNPASVRNGMYVTPRKEQLKLMDL